ncbi:MAG: glycosyltransferase family 4 protein [Bacteroidota bacterium]
MRVLLVTRDFPPSHGGIQTYAYELATRLAQKAEALEVIAPAQDGDADFDAALPFPVHRLAIRSDLLVLRVLPMLPRLARDRRFDVAFHAQWQTLPASQWARRRTGFPRRIVTAAHGRELLLTPGGTSPLGTAFSVFRRRALANIDALLPVSRYTADLARDLGVPDERLRIVTNGTDPRQFFPEDAMALREELGLTGRRVLLTVGRLVPRKGLDTTLHALAQLRRDDAYADVTYLVVGDGPDRDRLVELADDLDVTGAVRFLGRVEGTLRAYFNLADVFVMPSRAEGPDVEGFGIVFLEANACGTPVIGSTAGGIPDAIVDGETGLLVPPNDAGALAVALRRLLDDAALRTRFGVSGRARVEQAYTWDRVASRVYRTLEDLVSDASSPTAST